MESSCKATMSDPLDDGRPPLAPVGPGRRRHPPIDQSHATSETHFSDDFDGSEFDDMENQFDLMHVKIIIYGLSGILCRKSEKKRRRLHPSCSTGNNIKVATLNKKSAGSSTISSKEAAVPCGEDIFFMQVPTTAVLVFERQAFSSQSSMLSYLPSLPLGIPSCSNSISSRYAASWPADLHASFLNEECSAMDRSSFTFTRVMKHESYVRGQSCNALSSYVPQTIDLMVHLGRGTEMIPLGITSLVITGDEETEVQLNLPVKQLQFKNNRVLKALKACRRKSFFSNDSSNVFSLDENARLRIGLLVNSHKTLMAAKAREDREQEMMAELEKFVDEITMVPLEFDEHETVEYNNDEHETIEFNDYENENPLLLGSVMESLKSELWGGVDRDSTRLEEMEPFALSPVSARPQTNFFCGAVICNERGTVAEHQDFIFSDLTPRTRSVISRPELSFRESSVMSSISESTDDESDYTDMAFLNRQIVLIKGPHEV